MIWGPEEGEGIYDLGAPAATAIHDQACAEAREILRTCKHFVMVAECDDGMYAFAASAPGSLLLHAEMMVRHHAVRLLTHEFLGEEE